jgi:hypothetical protein
MVRDIPLFVFCYKFYLIIKKLWLNLQMLKVSMCVDIAKLYETLTLNAIAIFMFISNNP